jgi:hypothetical protein
MTRSKTKHSEGIDNPNQLSSTERFMTGVLICTYVCLLLMIGITLYLGRL